MSRVLALLRGGQHRLAVEVLCGIALALALLARIHGLDGLEVAGLGFLVGATLLVVIQAPIGTVPLGYAFVIALSELVRVDLFFLVVALGLLTTVAPLATRYPQTDVLRSVLRWALAGGAAGAAAAAINALAPGTTGNLTLLHLGVEGVAFLTVDVVFRRLLPTTGVLPLSWSAAWPVQLSLLCAAGLFGVAYREGGPWMASVALLPLVLTRFAFDRYAAAERTYRQTIKALSIVPEVAMVTALGHGERSAVYAVALAREIGLGHEAVARLATAARLHHIGYVTLDEPEEARGEENRRLLARLGGDILRETGFLADVGDLVESVHCEVTEVSSEESAVLRVASAFDHLVGEDPSRTAGALEILGFRHRAPDEVEAVRALRRLLEFDRSLVDDAIASGAPLTAAASASGAVAG